MAVSLACGFWFGIMVKYLWLDLYDKRTRLVLSCCMNFTEALFGVTNCCWPGTHFWPRGLDRRTAW